MTTREFRLIIRRKKKILHDIKAMRKICSELYTFYGAEWELYNIMPDEWKESERGKRRAEKNRYFINSLISIKEAINDLIIHYINPPAQDEQTEKDKQ